jgi:hypothetical protein
MSRFNSNQLISKTVSYLNRVSGHSANKANEGAKFVKSFKGSGSNKMPESIKVRAERLAKVEAGRTMQTRVKTGVGATAIAGAGFLGLHKYHQHKDNQILSRIDKIYEIK